ncbi:GDP-mannose 4,6-dehydratase [Aspergillus pseudodeflectus]|uniref:GDP-mannose 4,6-dehydratase n=1 Tax=Aspergillus pseudodeflectus TaxID=176178 RepID=A0ABR4JR42_9EURO
MSNSTLQKDVTASDLETLPDALPSPPSSRPRAFITGITGQDGSYLATLLLSKGYAVHGLIRRSSTAPEGSNLENLREIRHHPDLTLHKGDICDPHCIISILVEIQPIREIYHLAAQSHVTSSFEIPEVTVQVNVLGTLNVLQAVRVMGMRGKVRVYNATTSEIFGGVNEAQDPLNEMSLFSPRSPYAISKLSAYWLARNFRDAYGLFVVNGILFNHESARRSIRFVTKRIASGAARYKLGIADAKHPLTLAGIDMARDFGHAEDYVRGMWLMLQQDEPRDLVLATGVKTTVRDFVEMAFARVGVVIRWQGTGPDLKGLDVSNGETVVEIDRKLFRPSETECLIGDSRVAREILGWEPLRSIEGLIAEMVDSELARLSK